MQRSGLCGRRIRNAAGTRDSRPDPKLPLADERRLTSRAAGMRSRGKMRFVHTSDWQIGKTFRFADEASQVLRDERLEAVTKLGQLARAEGAPAVLVPLHRGSDRLLVVRS